MWDKFPVISYQGEKAVDITRRFVIKEEFLTKATIFYDYHITDWVSPENLAFDVYGSVNAAWCIFIANNIIDPMYDWLMTDKALRKYCEFKYGALRLDSPHHYIVNGTFSNSNATGAIMVTNYEYEWYLNEQKRAIRLVKPEFYQTLASQLKTALQGK